MEKFVKCPECEAFILDTEAVCPECGHNMVPPVPVPMRRGNVSCQCGQSFFVESVYNTVACISCGTVHDITHIPLTGGETDGTTI